MLKPMLLTDEIRSGLDQITSLIDAEAAKDPEGPDGKQLRDANRWIRYQLERNQVERQRKKAQRERSARTRPVSKPLPPNTPPVKWPEWRRETKAAA